MAELRRQTQQSARVGVLCFHFFDYDFNDALAVLMIEPEFASLSYGTTVIINAPSPSSLLPPIL
jgi:hypothetical protein